MHLQRNRSNRSSSFLGNIPKMGKKMKGRFKFLDNSKVMAVALYVLMVSVGILTAIYCYERNERLKFGWEHVYAKDKYTSRQRRKIENYLRRQRKLIEIREKVYDRDLEQKIDLNQMIADQAENQDKITYQIFVADENNFYDVEKPSWIVQSKIVGESVTFTKDLSILNEYSELHDVYDLKDIVYDNTNDESCLTFSFRTRKQWYTANANRNCKVINFILEQWVSSSYLYMGIGTGAAQREGNKNMNLFQYVHESPAHWVVQTWYFPEVGEGRPKITKEEVVLEINFELPEQPLSRLHCLTLTGTVASGDVYKSDIDNSCYSAKKNVNSFNNHPRTYDAIRVLRSDRAQQRDRPDATARDAAIIFKFKPRDSFYSNTPKFTANLKFGVFAYPLQSMLINKNPTKITEDVCLHLSIVMGSLNAPDTDEAKTFHRYLYLETNCELFLRDVEKAKADGLRVQFINENLKARTNSNPRRAKQEASKPKNKKFGMGKNFPNPSNLFKPKSSK